MIDGINAYAVPFAPVEYNKEINPVKTSSAGNAKNSSRDTVSISVEATKLRDQLMMINALTSINGKEIKDLRVVDNVLTLEKGAFYRFLLGNDQYMIVTGRGGMVIEFPYDEIGRDFNSDYMYFSADVWPVFDRMQFFMQALNDHSVWFLRTEFTRAEVLENCKKLGIEPGWVEINNAGSGRK